MKNKLSQYEWEQQAKEQKADEEVRKKIEDGELVPVLVNNKFFPKKTKRFTGFQMEFEEVIKDKEMGLTDIRVFNYMLAKLDFDNFIQYTQSQIAEHIGTKRPKVTQSIKKLERKKIIKKIKVGKHNYYQLNPQIAWKGETERWKKVVDIRDHIKQQNQDPDPF